MPRKTINRRVKRLLSKGHPYKDDKKNMPKNILKKVNRGERVYNRRFKNIGPGKKR